MILRFRGPDGQFRLEVDPKADFHSIISQVGEKLPSTVDLQSVKISNKPHGGDARPLSQLQGITFEQVGLQ